MLKLREIILKLSEQDYSNIASELLQTKAGKFYTVFVMHRENQLSDDEIICTLNLYPNAFSALRSRVLEKIQEYFLNKIQIPVSDILHKVANIPELVHHIHRDTAIAILMKIEKELIEHDLP